MSITSRHDSSGLILEKIKQIVSQRVSFSRDSTAFDMGVQATRDQIARAIQEMENRRDPTRNS